MNVKQSLSRFLEIEEGDLPQKAEDFFRALNIGIEAQESRVALPFEELYKQSADKSLPKVFSQVYEKIESCFLIGTMEKHSLSAIKQGEKEAKFSDIFFFAADAKEGVLLTRSEIAALTRAFNRISSRFPVVLVIRCRQGSKNQAAGGVKSDFEEENKKGVFLSLSICERTDYFQQWRAEAGQRLGKVRVMMDINCFHPHRGHLDMLIEISEGMKDCATFDAVYDKFLEIFSVSLLTKNFYKELQKWYFLAARLCRFQPEKDAEEKQTKICVIRLITRFIFVWFIKQKGLVNSDLFDLAKLEFILKDFQPHSKQSGTYYNAIVQNLFFAVLNQKIEERAFIEKSFHGKNHQHTIKTFFRCKDLFSLQDEKQITDLFARSPFVNGSLFECLDNREDNGKIVNFDGFSDTPKRRAFVPDMLFFGDEDENTLYDFSEEYGEKHESEKVKSLIPLLKSYYFTIQENTPSEEQIALDPELLGRIFENLLGLFNPETQEQARKSTGSFYTPREIVDYMCTQSLKEYFVSALPAVNPEKLDLLLDETVSQDSSELFNDEEKRLIINAIYNIKILDPACGSGAFPMGILQKLVNALRILDADNTNWREVLIQRAGEGTKEALRQTSTSERQERINEITATFERQSSHPDYTRKLYVIQRCIYGVDVQPIAIQISKLRFFVSLLCEQRTNTDPADNFGIMALPNLETNLVAANSLIAKQKQAQCALESFEVSDLRARRDKIRAAHFSAHTKAQKNNLEAKDKEISEQLLEAMVKDGMYTREEAEDVIKWSPYDATRAASFFDAEWMFGTDKFDVVIGNPPYGAKLDKNTLAASKTYELKTTESAILFIERGFKLVKNGILTFVVPKSFCYASNYSACRDFTKECLTEIADCGKAFKNVLFEAIVIRLEKRKTHTDFYKSKVLVGENFSNRANIQKSTKEFFGFFLNDVSEQDIDIGMKIRNRSIMLTPEVASNVGGGMFYKEVKSEGDYYVLGGKQIQRYYLAKTAKGKIGKGAADLETKSNINDNVVLVQNIVSHIQNPSPHIKIIAFPTDAIPTHKILNTVNQLTLKDGYSNKYISALLNSALLNWYAYRFVYGKAIRTMHFWTAATNRIPIFPASAKQQQAIAVLVEQILKAKRENNRADTSALEEAIDHLVYDLYDLTQEERKVIGAL